MRRIFFLKIICVLFCFFSTFAYAANNSGFYLGAQIGFSNNGSQELQRGKYPYIYNDLINDLLGTSFLRNLSGRLDAGYRFNKFLAAELGYASYLNNKTSGGVGNEDSHYKLYGFDLDAKGIIPFTDSFGIFGKLGIAFIQQDFVSAYNGGNTVTYKVDNTRVMPLLGAGIMYHCTSHLASELFVNYLRGGDGALHDIIFSGVGFSFTF